MAAQTQIQVAVAPSVIPVGVPPGLEFLLPTNQIIIEEIREWGLFTVHAHKQYNILDCWGRRMFFAAENYAQSSMCGGDDRSWVIDVYNSNSQPVLTGSRSGGRGCDSNECYVSNTPTGMRMGGIVENLALGTSWNIVDGNGTPIFFLDKPVFQGWATKEFPLYTFNEPRQQIGKISRAMRGFFSTEDTFGVEFPVTLDVKVKAVLIYATFLIDFMFYDNRHDRKSR